MLWDMNIHTDLETGFDLGDLNYREEYEDDTYVVGGVTSTHGVYMMLCGLNDLVRACLAQDEAIWF